MSLYDDASLIVYPSGYKESKIYAQKPIDGSGDLTFARASSATRVNEQGLIETAATIGSELVTNGDFATDIDWSIVGTGWDISSGKLNGISASGNTQQTLIPVENGKNYQIKFTISNWTNGDVYVRPNNLSGTAFYVNGNGDYVENFTAISTSITLVIRARPSTTFTGSIDNVSIKEYTTANIPRIDYTNGCGQLLLEPQRTNLVTQSVDLSSWSVSAWTKTINSATAPDGTNTANLIEQATNGLIYANSATAESTLSVFLKYNSAMQFFQIMGNGDANTYANFDIVNGLVGNIGSLSKAEIKDYGSGWYRISMTILTGATLANFRIKSVTSLTAAWNNGTVFSGSFYAWGGQVETGYPTSYIPTSGTTVTRIKDQTSISGLSGDLGTSYTLYAYYDFYSPIGGGSARDWLTSANGNVYLIYNYGGGIDVYSGSAFLVDRSTLVEASNFKIAIVSTPTTVKVFINGVDKTNGTPSPNTSVIDTWTKGSNNSRGTILNELTHINRELTDAEAITLTTL
jgi:hypothetical protein